MVETGPNDGGYMFRPRGEGREIRMPDGTLRRFRVVDAAFHPAMKSAGFIRKSPEFTSPPKSTGR